jgi:GTP-dependent phosphoenolpyruvate carboxykinase
MTNIFDIDTTRKQQIIVEYITDTGSGFAVNPKGEQVFMNARLVNAMKVEPGDSYDAFLLPNYPDKREQIPWRAMRVEPIELDLDMTHVSVDKKVNRIIEYMQLDMAGVAYTAREISEELQMDHTEVLAILEKMPETFTKVDAYILLPTDK